MAGGRRRKRVNKPKARQSVKDHFAHAEDEFLEVTEELTALSAIFQEDFTLISEDPFKEFSIGLQPHSGETGSHLQNVSAELYVRCFPGYPNKPPKLQVRSKEGLSEEEARSLHSMLVNQASSISREGRVMIFNLVEAAQEFLSKYSRHNLSQDQQEDQEATSTGIDSCVAVSNPTPYTLQELEVPSVYGVVDLFTELDEDCFWKVGPYQKKNIESQKNVGGSIANVGRQEPLAFGYIGVRDQHSKHGEVNTLALQGKNKALDKFLLSESKSKPHVGKVGTEKLTVSDEKDKNVDICVPNTIQFSSVTELLQNLYTGTYAACCKNSISVEQDVRLSLLGKIEQESKAILPLESTCLRFEDGPGVSVRKDFLLVHLLRLACCPRGPLPHALPALALQLQKLDMIPHWTTDLVCNQPQLFDMAFHAIFADCIREMNGSSEKLAPMKSFWNAIPDLLGKGDSTHSRVTSRYTNDFEEISLLGKGGFGYVVLCRNNLDGRQYAMKKIRLKDRSPLNNKILREVATLSRLQHRHIVRYYQAWFETVLGFVNAAADLETSEEWILSGTIDQADSSFLPLLPNGLTISDIEEKLVETIYLYIQMEYCPRTLREVLNSSTKPMDEATVWVMFRQIVEGLVHIHGQGIIHRDLNPSNIFFDVTNDIKIGDFGLAKFTNLEQPEREPLSTIDSYGGSLDGTGQVGTYFYTAPEVEQAWPHINEKVDMYSLGVVLFELWHPFVTAMERHIVLSELKNKGIPSSWAIEFPQQAVLVKNLMASNPTDRPSAMHVLRNNLPPRMEDEALDDVLRTIQRGDHSYVFDQITSALFDEGRLSLIAQKSDREELNPSFTQKTFIQDQILLTAKEVFMCHGAHEFSSQSMSLIDDRRLSCRQAVRLMDSAGRMLELRSEMRIRFACWVAANQVSSIKRFEISQVYRKAAGPSAPQEYYQGDFDIIGETFGLAEAESIKVVVDIIRRSAITDLYEICINHVNILEAIWSWSGVKNHQRKDVAKLLSSVGCASPHSSDRKSRWVHIRRQLVEGLQLPEDVVDRLQTVERRWSGPPEEALSRLRGGLADSALISSAIDELSTLQSYLRVWTIGKHVHVDALMAPAEECYKGIYFQVHMPKGCCHATLPAGMLLAVGGSYNQLVQQFWTSSQALPAPGAVGISIALEKLILAAASESSDPETGAEVLVCSKGGGGMLRERMQVASELWDGNIKAEFVHSPSPSLTEQYEHARENGIKWLVIITEAGLDHANSVKVRHMELRVEEDLSRANLVRFLSDAPVTAIDIRKQATLLREGN